MCESKIDTAPDQPHAYVVWIFAGKVDNAPLFNGMAAQHRAGLECADQFREQQRYRSLGVAGLTCERIDEAALKNALDQIVRRLEVFKEVSQRQQPRHRHAGILLRPAAIRLRRALFIGLLAALPEIRTIEVLGRGGGEGFGHDALADVGIDAVGGGGVLQFIDRLDKIERAFGGRELRAPRSAHGRRRVGGARSLRRSLRRNISEIVVPQEIGPYARANFDTVDIWWLQSDELGNDGVNGFEFIHSGQLPDGVDVLLLGDQRKNKGRHRCVRSARRRGWSEFSDCHPLLRRAFMVLHSL